MDKRDADRAKEKSKAAYDALYDRLTQEQTARIRTAAVEVEANKGRAKKIREIENRLAIDLIDIETNRINDELQKSDLIEDERERLNNRLIDLDQARADKELEISKRSFEAQQEKRREILDATTEIIGRSFDIANNIYDAQMQRIEQMHDYEIAAAGDSVEKRIIAERKYERERAKIMRKQAIAERAQTAFSIIINTAEAVVKSLENPVLAAIIAGLGAVQLATVLSTPIPQFAKGTDAAPEVFIAGEKGQEAIIKPSGDVVLTPDKPTLFSDKSLIGSTILPHDETQRMLANYAINQSYDMIDMSATNKFLKTIANNTRGGKEIFTRNGSTIMKRGYITSTII